MVVALMPHLFVCLQSRLPRRRNEREAGCSTNVRPTVWLFIVGLIYLNHSQPLNKPTHRLRISFAQLPDLNLMVPMWLQNKTFNDFLRLLPRHPKLATINLAHSNSTDLVVHMTD